MSEQQQRPPGTFKVGTIAGSDVLVSSSWFVIAGLIALIMAPAVDRVEPGLGGWKYVAGFLFAVVLYGSVLLHEASHAVVAKRYGFQVKSITLHFLGGMTAIDGEARTPRQEFWIAVVGPLTSLAVGLAAGALWLVVPDGLLGLGVATLTGANLLVGVLNLLPALPLDGGRVLKSAVWKASGSAFRGTVVAAWGGRVLAVLALGWPLAMEAVVDRPPDLVDWALAAVVAVFLWGGASAALTNAQIRQRLPRLVARDLARRTISVPADLPLAEAVRRAQEAHAGGIVTTDPAGRPVGLVNEAALLVMPEERRPWVPVSAVSRTLEAGLFLPIGIAGEELVAAIRNTPSAEYVMLGEDGGVYGVLATADVDQAFRSSEH